MGERCCLYKKPADMQYDLISELVSKITVEDWIDKYESVLKDRRKKK